MNKEKLQVWNKRVNPKDYPDFYHRKVVPVSWEELGNRFHAIALRQFHIDKDGFMDRYKEEIKLYTETYDLGDILWLHCSFIFAKNFKEVVHYIREKGLYIFDIWGYVPTSGRPDFPEYRADFTPHGNAHQYLLQILGTKFLGWSNGEQDGRYFGVYAHLLCPASQNRLDAYESFSKYFHRLGNHLENYLTALLGMYFAHHIAHLGNHRLLGAETAQALPSVPPWYSFIRGAGKQYGILWFGNASVFNRWGYKRYDKKEIEKEYSPGKWCGQDHGTSLALLKRLWYVEYMYGSCMMGYEAGHILDFTSEDCLAELTKKKKDAEKPFEERTPPLTPIGQLQVDCTKWCKKHPDIGVQYTPVVLLMDFYTGWAPPRTLYNYTGAAYLVWGNIPYQKGDHQIDAFFRLVYPSYEDSSYYKDERGFLTPTPVGDIFDVLLSNVNEEILHQYNLVVLLGEIRLEGKLLDKIKRFLKAGGEVIVSLNQISEEAREEFGIKSANLYNESKVSRLKDSNKDIEEKLFQYEIIDTQGADILATSKEADPLILRMKYGKGKIVIITTDFGLNKEENKEHIPTTMDEGVSIPAKYYLLECVKHILLDYFKKLNLVEVKGAPIQYITNVTDDSKKIYLTLSNNDNKPWRGKIIVKEERNFEVEDLFKNKKLASSKEGFKADVEPLDVSIYSIKTKEPVVTFKDPFRKEKDLGYKMAVWTRASAKASIWENVEIIGRSSFSYIEICATQVLKMDDVELSLLLQEMKAGNLSTCALGLVHAQTPYIDNNNLTNSLPWTLDENREFLSRSLKVCEALETKTIIVSPGKLAEIGQSYKEAFHNTASAISEFGRKAKDLGITILIQPAPGRFCGKSEELIKLIDEIDLANVAIALDTGHTYWFGENPLESLKKIGDRVKYINLNSPFNYPGGGLIDKHLPLGEGLFNQSVLDNFLKELKKSNFHGILSLNSYFPEPLPKHLQEALKGL